MPKLNRFARVLYAAGLVAITHLSASAAPMDGRFEAAMQQYDDSHYGAAYEQFASLADQGHDEAARIALLMARFGPQLYGHQWPASAEQKAHWQQVVSRGPSKLVADRGL